MAAITDRIKNFFKFEAAKQPGDNPMLDVELSLTDPLNLFPRGKAGMFRQYNPNRLVRSKGLKIFDLIRRDEQAKSALLFKKYAITSSGWDIAPPDGFDQDHEPTRFIKSQLQNLSGTLERNLMAMLTAMDYGYSITEKVYTDIPDGPWSGMVGLKYLKTKKPHYFRFDQDEFGNVRAIIQEFTPKGDLELPPQKFVVYSYQAEFSNPYGVSDLDSAYRPWYFKDNAYKWLGMYLERFGIPPIFALYNDQKYKGPMLAKITAALKNLQAASSGAIPRGDKDDLELWSPEIGGQASRVFIPILEKYDTDIAKAILMPGQLGVSPESSVGSNARAVTIFDLFMMIIEAVRSEMAETVMQEQVIKPLYYFNYSDPEQCPVFKWLPIDNEANIELLKAWGELVGQKVVISTETDEQHIRSEMGFPERDSEDPPLVDDPDDDDLDPDDDGPAPDDDDDEPELNENKFTLGREPNQYESRVNFKQVAAEMDKAERLYIDTLRSILIASRDQIVKRYGNKPVNQKMIRTVTKLPNIGQLKRALKDLMLSRLDDGRADALAELKKVAKFKDETGPNYTPREAIAHINTKAIELASTTNDQIIKEVKRVLITGIETGATGREVADSLRGVFEPWVGDPSMRRGDQQLKPHRLEVIVRTESTAAYNQGRLVESRRPGIEQYMRGMEYSAIIDSRTTEVCRDLDGRIFKISDPALDNLRPPNHFNCRSVLVPVTEFDEINEADYITPSQTGRAVEQAGAGFVK